MKTKYIIILFLLSLVSACVTDGTESSDASTGTGGSMARFTCKGDYLYVVDQTYLQTFNISDPTKISLRSRIKVGGSMETIFPTDTLLFLGSTSGMYAYSLKTPDFPRYVSVYNHFTSCDPVVVQGRYAFVTLRSDPENFSCSRSVNELKVIDIANVNNPIEKMTYPMTNPKGLAIDGNLLFLCDGLDLVVMNAENPLKMLTLKRFEMDGVPYDLIAKNGMLTVSYSAGIKQYAYTGDTIVLKSTLY